jgi:hypothetical protein
MKELCDEDVNLQDPRHILLLHLPVRREKIFFNGLNRGANFIYNVKNLI